MSYHPDTFVAPLGAAGQRPYLGTSKKKPWHYKVTATIPHLNTPEMLNLVVQLLRRQTLRPYIIVVDTGSPEESRHELEKLRAEDLEIHYIRSHAYTHTSESVAQAMDLSFALCRSELLFCTHSDCFLQGNDFVEWLAQTTDSERPVVGYRICPKPWPDWQRMVSHTATMLHMPTMHRIGATWSFQRAGWKADFPAERMDTEWGFNHCLFEAGIEPRFIGFEENWKRHTDQFIDHVRSVTSTNLYVGGDLNYLTSRDQWIADALLGAQQRIEKWQPLPLP